MLIISVIKNFGKIIVLSALFYHSLLAVPCLIPVLVFFVRREKREKEEKAQKQLNQQFGDSLQAVCTAIHAGYSVESAFVQAKKDLYMLYGEGTPIITEFTYLCSGLAMNETIEELLAKLAERTGLPDVKSFAEVFATAKRTGGDLPEVISYTTSAIRSRLETEREIDRMIASRRFEQQIMNLMPCLILLFVNISSPDFLAPLYGNPAGILLMTICLCLYGGAYLLGDKLVKFDL